MASTSVVDFANFVPIQVDPQECFGDDTVIDDIYRDLAKEGITRENISILTNNSPALIDANKQIIMQRYKDEEEAYSHLINTNELIEYLVIDLYGENDLDIPVNSIISYICLRLWREAGITMMDDLERLTGGTSQLTSDAKDQMLYRWGEEIGVIRIARINNFLRFLYDNGMKYLFGTSPEFQLIPYIGDEKKECSICYGDNAANLVSTPCNHIFHYTCIAEWLKTHSTCPLCRKQF